MVRRNRTAGFGPLRCPGQGIRVTGRQNGTPPAGRSGPGFSRALAVLVAGAFFMENLDATIIAPAAPKAWPSTALDEDRGGKA